MLIGITGPAGVGKDTAANYLVEHHGFVRYGFADPLKKALSVLGIHEPKNREDKEKRLPGRKYSFRHAAQTLGTDWARKLLDDGFWLHLAEEAVNNHNRVVISDVRFENESDWVREMGGKVLHLSGRKAQLAGDTATHPSEKGLAWGLEDAHIDNSGEIQELHKRLAQLVRDLI